MPYIHHSGFKSGSLPCCFLLEVTPNMSNVIHSPVVHEMITLFPFYVLFGNIGTIVPLFEIGSDEYSQTISRQHVFL